MNELNERKGVGGFAAAADGRAEGSCRLCHESFDLLHSARNTSENLQPVSRHCNVLFTANLRTKQHCSVSLSLAAFNAEINNLNHCRFDENPEIIA